MKSAVTLKKSVTILAALNAVAKCAGVASYVTLVFLLTQKNLTDQAGRVNKQSTYVDVYFR